ncbi:MAG: PBSX family phage terminase large subunit [Acidiferrobacterales bacterium]|nr:PBSX family phage terminase large subunit [Acidiferrobacterales bacterium]
MSSKKRASMNPALKDVWSKPSRIKVIYGGRGSSKSWDAAANAVRIARFTKIRFLCTRMFQNKIKESVYSLLKIQIERFNLQDEFEVLRDSIKHKKTGSEFLFYGLARNIEEIKSLESIDVCWIEEAHALTEDMWDILEPTIRKDGSEFWIIFNPKFVTDFVYQRFVVKPPRKAVLRKINYPENPFLSKTALETAEEKKAEDYERFKHVYLGEPRTDDDQVIIKWSWIEAAIGFDLEASGKRVIGYDVADEGEDDSAIVMAHGSYVYGCDAWSKGDVIESARKVYAIAQSEGAEITYDSIGVGAGSKAEFRQLAQNEYRTITAHGFNAGGAVSRPDSVYKEDKTNKDHFANIKAQAWFTLADRFYNTYRAAVYGDEFPVDKLISINPDLPHLEELKFELTAPRREYDGNMRVKVESKKDMKKRGIKSPNIADALVMCFVPDQTGGFVNLFGG